VLHEFIFLILINLGMAERLLAQGVSYRAAIFLIRTQRSAAKTNDMTMHHATCVLHVHSV